MRHEIRENLKRKKKEREVLLSLSDRDANFLLLQVAEPSQYDSSQLDSDSDPDKSSEHISRRSPTRNVAM